MFCADGDYQNLKQSSLNVHQVLLFVDESSSFLLKFVKIIYGIIQIEYLIYSFTLSFHLSHNYNA